MSTLKVYDGKGAPAGAFEVDDALLVLDRGEQAVHDAVTAYRARQRAGTASTLRKGEVAGSNRKPWRQKGTGRARAGLRQSPVWRGGGVAFGPHPRKYGGKVNRRVARLAFSRALSERISAGDVKVVESLEMAEGKTRGFVAFLKALKIEGRALVLAARVGRNLALAARNVAGVEVLPAAAANVYQVLRYPVIVADREGMEVLRQRLERDGRKTP
ncbi:MAG: 50S ribosomal protein L4 [Lentisphaerae bacterium]|nr:50S ribosomal protein L4 [Lentisphaerota bacterium]